MGGKVRLGKEIAEIIKDYHRTGQVYYEPFVGGLGLFRYIPIEWVRVINDVDRDLMSLWNAIAYGYMPDTRITEEIYNTYKSCPELLDHRAYERAFMSYFLSFGGIKWGGYCKDNRGDDYYMQAYRDLQRISPALKHAVALSMDYTELPYVPNSLIYCDPPYNNTASYKDTEFDSDYFYKWCRAMAIKGHTVLVSEYTAPNAFECIWTRSKKVTINSKNNKLTKTERLYLVK